MTILIFHFQEILRRQVQCSCFVGRQNVSRRRRTLLDDLLQILHRPGEAGFADSLVAHLNIGKQFFGRVTHHRGLCMELSVQFSRINRF